MNIKTLLILVN